MTEKFPYLSFPKKNGKLKCREEILHRLESVIHLPIFTDTDYNRYLQVLTLPIPILVFTIE